METGTDEKWLARMRVLGKQKRHTNDAEMTEEQILARRSYIRRTLRNFPEWCNLPNDTIDQITLQEVDGGYLVEDTDGYEFMIYGKNVGEEEAEFRKMRAMMPFEFMHMTGKDFDWSKYHADISGSRNTVNQYITKYPKFRERGMGLYICSGTKGSGKTMLSCCILNEISRRYHGSIKFVNTLDFLEMTKKGYQGGEDEVKQLYEASILVMDDIGVQMAKEWTDTVFYRLINDRYTNRKPTIYTSNIPAESLRMDDRITDRIESTTYLVGLPEEPIRRYIRQQDKQKLMNEIVKGPGR